MTLPLHTIDIKKKPIGIHHLDDETALIIDNIERYSADEAEDNGRADLYWRTGGAFSKFITGDAFFWDRICVDDNFQKPQRLYSKVVFLDLFAMKNLTDTEAAAVLLHEHTHAQLHCTLQPSKLTAQQLINCEIEADAHALKYVGVKTMLRTHIKSILGMRKFLHKYYGYDKVQSYETIITVLDSDMVIAQLTSLRNMLMSNSNTFKTNQI